MVNRRSTRSATRPVPVVEKQVDSDELPESRQSDNSIEEDETIEEEKQVIVKARLLKTSDTTGKDIYGFKTPKRKEALVKAAEGSVHSAKRTGKKRAKTPVANNAIAKEENKLPFRIQSINLAENPVDSSDEEESDQDVSEEEDAAENQMENHAEKNESDILDEYFRVHNTNFKTVTSDKTLSKLQNPKMKQDELLEHLKDVQATHISEITKLHIDIVSYFDKWMFQLLCGFNVLLYGLGSKHRLLNQFRTKCLIDLPHIVINGFFPNITIKQILNMITEDLLDSDKTFKNVIEHYSFIKKEFDADSSNQQLFIVLHNIDGHMLRSQTTQNALAHLSSAKNIHVIASVDHINAPLIWDQNRANAFNWLWYDATTFEPYQEETSYENSMLVHQSGSLALSSLTHVLRSLTSNAKGIFKLLAQHLLDNESNSGYQGLSFSELYNRCREQFLVNSDLNLRAQLTEFKDHKLIKIKKGYDGIEYLSVAIECATVKQFLETESS